MLPGEPVTEINDAPADDAVEAEGGSNEYDETNLEGASGDTEGTPAPEAEAAPADPYADFGGREAVERAMALHKMTTSQDGIMRIMFESARAMGIPLSQVEALFTPAAPQGNAPAEPEYADDDLITWGQVKQLLAQEVIQPLQQSQAQQAEAAARNAVASARSELGIEDDATWNAVLQLGDRYLGDDISPQAVAEAVRRGHADFVNLVKSNAKAYVERKAEVKKTVPKAPAGGGMPAAAPEPEPKTVEEAIARARKRLMG